MSILNKYNQKPMFEYDNTKERQYITLKGLVEQFGINTVYDIHAIFINNKSRFGDAPIFVIEHHLVNMPQHLLETVKEMINDVEIIEMMNKRKVGFKIYSYQGKNGNGYSVELIEK